MARVTVEDCILKVPNRFELVMMAGQRARDILSGAPLTIDRDNDKNPVVALREIADGTVSIDTLRDALVKGHQKHVESDEPEEEIIELMTGEEEWLRRADPEAAETGGLSLLDEEPGEDGELDEDEEDEDLAEAEAEAEREAASAEGLDEDGEGEGEELEGEPGEDDEAL